MKKQKKLKKLLVRQTLIMPTTITKTMKARAIEGQIYEADEKEKNTKSTTKERKHRIHFF